MNGVISSVVVGGSHDLLMCINPKIYDGMMVTLACKREIKWESNDDISGSNTKEMCFGPAFSQKLLIVVIVVGVEHNSNINTAKLLKLFE